MLGRLETTNKHFFFNLGLKDCANGFGHMNKMAAMPIYGKTFYKICPRTRRPITLGLGMLHGDVGSTKSAQMMVED